MRLTFIVKIFISILLLTIIQLSSFIHPEGKKKLEKNIKHGVIDRIIHNEQAIILLLEKDEQLIIPITELPNGSKEGVCLNLYVSNGDVVAFSIDKEKTLNQLEENRRIHKRLQQKITD